MSAGVVVYSLDTLPQTSQGGPISSQYILYANGIGQSFWAPTVSQSSIDTLSSYNAGQVSSLSTSIGELAEDFTILSTLTLSTMTGQMVSSATSLGNDFAVLSNQYNILSNSLSNSFVSYTNSTTTLVNSIYTSTIDIVTSTLTAISSISTFITQIAAVQASLDASSSTLSTAIAVTNASTTAALTTASASTLQAAVVSTTQYINSQTSTISTIYAEKADVQALSTGIRQALLSTSAGLQSSIDTNYSTLYTDLIGFEASTFSTQTWAISTLNVLNSRISALESMSTQLSSQIVAQVSSYTAPLFSTQSATTSVYTSSLLASLSSLTYSTLQNTLAISSISSYTGISVSSLQSQIIGLSSGLSTLNFEFSVLTTSSILAGIYLTFIELENYTTGLINSTISSVSAFTSILQYSTTVQNTSTATGFFNSFVSSTYASTVITVVPLTNAYVSSLVSTLYSTGSAYLTSSFDSTIFGKTTEFNSTTSGLTSSILSSTTEQINSSILSYLSAPTASSLAAFSTAGAQAISTFNGAGASTLRFQSTTFGSTFVVNQALMSTLSGQGSSTITQLSAALSTFNTQSALALSSFAISTTTLLSTQNSQFTSSLGSYQTQLTNAVNSTNTSVLATTTAAANQALSTLVISTTATYNAFVASLNASISTISLSSLYTEQTITLTSNTFEGTMDLGAFRNFNINVRSPLVSGSSNYRVNTTTDLSTLNYRQGVITVDVSTIGAGYSNNGGQLALDVYRWGIPTTVFGSVYPYISSSDYTAMYEYTIVNSIVYTNLLNVYPRLRINALTLGAGQQYNVFTGASVTSNFLWRRTPLRLQWSNYSFFPFNTVGAPPYSPDIVVDMVVGSNVVSRNGPYAPTTSTLTLALPAFSGSCNNPITTRIRTYYVGKQADAAELTINVLVPKFQDVRLTPATGRFVSLQEIQGWTDGGVNIFQGTTAIELTGTAAGSNLALGGSNVTFGKANAVDGNSGTICVGPTSVNVPDANAALRIIPALTTTTSNISSITLFNVASSCNQARGGIGDGALELNSSILRTNVLIGATQYYSSITLTSASVQRFSF